MISVDMLGPATFRYGGQAVELRPLEKVIHMAVYVAGGRLSMARLVEDVWSVPTAGSAATLRGCLSKARAKVVAAGGTAEQLSRTIKISGGQSVVSLPDSWQVDTTAFQQHASDASKAYESGRFADAYSYALAALSLWYEDPLPDAGQRAFAVPFVEQLRGIHWATTLTRIKAKICLGRHREMLAELRQLAQRHPEEGVIAVLLATALYRSELTPEAALACKQGIVAWDRQGVDARRLQALQHAILNEAAPLTGSLGW